jgi:hypothetical protein
MKANDTLTSSETATDEAIALGIDISKTENYEEGQLTRFMSVEYKSDIGLPCGNEGFIRKLSDKVGRDLSFKKRVDLKKGSVPFYSKNICKNTQSKSSLLNKAALYTCIWTPDIFHFLIRLYNIYTGGTMDLF